MEIKPHCIIELLVNNHAGVMSHITGLFARRAFNLEGILCGGIGDGSKSTMFLLVNDDELIEQITKQLKKLHDVIEVKIHHDYDCSVFYNLDQLFIK